MKVCFDSNVVIDILGTSPNYFYSYSAYDVTLTRNFDAVIPMFTTSDIAYVLRAHYLDSQKTHKALLNLLVMFDVLDGHPTDCINAIDSDMTDYEDALIAFAAKRNDVDFIITRNKKDFLRSPVPALSPEEFVKIYKPNQISYESITY